MKTVHKELIEEFDSTAKKLSEINLTTHQDYERFEKLTWYQNGIRFAIELIESHAGGGPIE